jgi:hypothetical protein
MANKTIHIENHNKNIQYLIIHYTNPSLAPKGLGTTQTCKQTNKQENPRKREFMVRKTE